MFGIVQFSELSREWGDRFDLMRTLLLCFLLARIYALWRDLVIDQRYSIMVVGRTLFALLSAYGEALGTQGKSRCVHRR